MKQFIVIFLFCFTGIVVNQTANAQLGKLLDKAKKATNKIKEATSQTNEVVGNETNESNGVTKIVKETKKVSIFFSNKKFTNGTEGAKTEFEEGEYIYARLILPKPVKEYLDEENGDFFINSGSKDEYASNYSGSFLRVNASYLDKEATQIDIDVLPNPAEATTHFSEYMQSPADISASCSIAKNGEKISFLWELKDIQGTFSIKVKSGKTISQFIDPIIKKVSSFQADDDAMKEDLRPEFNEKSYAFDDPQINKQKIIGTLPDDAEVYKIVIGPGEDYTVIKNDLGIILRKQSLRYIYVTYKEKSTGYCYSVSVIFERDYEGNGKYGNLTWHNHGGRIDCSKIK